MGICHIARINKVIKYGCSFPVLPVIGPALLRIPYCEQLKQLTVNWETRDDPLRKQQINEKQIKISSKQNKKDNHSTNKAVNPEAHYIDAGPSAKKQ